MQYKIIENKKYNGLLPECREHIQDFIESNDVHGALTDFFINVNEKTTDPFIKKLYLKDNETAGSNFGGMFDTHMPYFLGKHSKFSYIKVGRKNCDVICVELDKFNLELKQTSSKHLKIPASVTHAIKNKANNNQRVKNPEDTPKLYLLIHTILPKTLDDKFSFDEVYMGYLKRSDFDNYVSEDGTKKSGASIICAEKMWTKGALVYSNKKSTKTLF